MTKWVAVLSGFALGIGCGPRAEFNVSVESNAHNPMSKIVTVEARDPDASLQIEHAMGTTPAQGPGEIYVQGLAADQSHDLTLLSEGEAVLMFTVETEPLEEAWTVCEALVPVEVTEEVICLAVRSLSGDRYGCVDRAGTLVWSLEHPKGEAFLAVAALPDHRYAAVSGTNASLYVFDERGELQTEYASSWFDDKTRYAHGFIGAHELIVLEQGPWAGAIAFLSQTAQTIDEEVLFAGGIIVLDLDSEEVLWDWHGHGDLEDETPISNALSYDRQAPWAEGERDWLGTNALLHHVDGDEQAFWISMRMQDWLVAVNPDTDEVLWRLGEGGDFDGASNAWFSGQHAPEVWSDGDSERVLLFDNSPHTLDGDGGASRVLELSLDTNGMTAEWIAELSGFYSPVGGDVDLSDDGSELLYVVGDPLDEVPYVAEVSWPAGEMHYQLGCDQSLYRAERYASIYDRWPESD